MEAEANEKRDEILRRVREGDETVFTDYSRWTIHALYLRGDFKKLPDEMRHELMEVIDSCRESL